MVCNKKSKPVFIKQKWNHIVFSRATILSFHSVCILRYQLHLFPITHYFLLNNMQIKYRNKMIYWMNEWYIDFIRIKDFVEIWKQSSTLRDPAFTKLSVTNIFLYQHSCINDVPMTLILFTNPSARAGCDTRSIFKRSLTGLNSEFSFSSTSRLTKAEEPSLLYYLPIARGRIIGFIPFARVFVLCEMTLINVYFITGTSLKQLRCIMNIFFSA